MRIKALKIRSVQWYGVKWISFFWEGTVVPPNSQDSEIVNFSNSRSLFSDFDWNGLIMLFSRLIREFPISRVFSAGTN